MKCLKEFLSNTEGLSSKRLGFIGSLATAISLTNGTTIFFLWKGQYALAVDLVQSTWWATFAFGGLVASEMFKKFKKR